MTVTLAGWKIIKDGGAHQRVKEMDTYSVVYNSILQGDEKAVLAGCRKLLSEGYSAIDILEQGLIPAMDRLGEYLNEGEKFIPQVLIASKAMQNAISLLHPLLTENEQEGYRKQNVVVIGTVQGDIHTIGKNLVAIMLRSAGCKVIDLGANVSAEKFINAIREHNANIVAMSALLTSSMLRMKQISRMIKEIDFGHPVRIIVGGGPITPNYAREIQAEFGATMVDTARKASFSPESGDNVSPETNKK